MTYDELRTLLDFTYFNAKEDNITPEVIVMDLCLNMATYNPNDHNVLFFRFQQYKETFSYPELITLFKMRNYAYTEEQAKTYSNFLYNSVLKGIGRLGNSIDDSYQKLIEDEKNHQVFQENIKELSAILKKDARALYDDIRTLVGDVIYEQIRYDLNPILGHNIAVLYDLMQDEVGNLIDKQAFINACKFESADQIKLLINTLHLAQIYDEFDDLMPEIVDNVNQGQFRNLFILHNQLLHRNPIFLSISEALSVVEKKDASSYDQKWLTETRQLISKLYDNNRDIDNNKAKFPQFNLHVIINGPEKFKNKMDDTQFGSGDAIQKQLMLAKQRLEHFGR